MNWPLLGWGLGFGVLASMPAGPVAVLILRNTLEAGARAGLVTAASLLAGELVYLLLFALGLGGAILGTPWLRDSLFLCGAATLLATGAQALRKQPPEQAGSQVAGGALAMFRTGFFITITNPALLLIFSGFLASARAAFGDEALARGMLPALLSMEAGTALWFGLLVLLLSRLPAGAAAWLRRFSGRLAGAVLIGFGLWLFVDTLMKMRFDVLQELLFNWFGGREEVRLATTAEEREALYRLRYEVYAVEKGWVGCGEDHERKRLVDAGDEAPSARHIYAGRPGDVKGTARLQVFEPGQVPERWARMYALHLIPGVERLRVAEVGRFAIRKNARGGTVMPSMIRFGFQHLIGTERVDLGFCECRPAMVRHYRKMGFRPYGAPAIPDQDGLQVPLIVVPSDLDYLDAVGAIIRSDARKHFRGKQAVDVKAFEHLFAEDNQRVLVEETQVFSELEEGLRTSTSVVPPWAFELPPRVFAVAASHGYILELDAGDALVGEGRSEQEGYIILDGLCEVTLGGEPVVTLGPGEIVGEMALFLPDTRRTASVRAIKPTRLVVLDRRFIDSLHRESPDDAYLVMRILARTLAGRLAETTRRWVESRQPQKP